LGDNEPWLSGIADTLRRSRAGLITDQGRVPWRELVERAQEVAADLPPSPHGLVVPPDGGPQSLVAMLAAGLAEPAPSWLLGDPDRWGAGRPVDCAALAVAGPHTAPPPEVDGATYATAVPAATGQAKLLYGRPGALRDTVRLYTEGMPEYADAELFASCEPMDVAATFHLVVLPAVVLGRDLMPFRPRQWRAAAEAFDGRSAVCLSTPAHALLGARVASAGQDHSRVSFVPAGGGLTAERAERVAAGFAGCSFLAVFTTPETGVLTVTREVREDGAVGTPLPGKRVWLREVDETGVGTMWAEGPDTMIAATGGPLPRTADGAVGSGDLAHVDPVGGFVLDGRVDDLVQVDGVSIHPADVVAALRDIRGVVDASMSVDRSGPTDRVTVEAVGDVTEDQVRRRLAALAVALVPHEVVCHPVGGAGPRRTREGAAVSPAPAQAVDRPVGARHPQRRRGRVR
jgi:hypothetical protein